MGARHLWRAEHRLSDADRRDDHDRRQRRDDGARLSLSGGDGAADAPAGTLALLRANRAFRTLWSARAISFAGDSLGLVALILYAADSTGEALAVALLLLIGDFAPALLGPLTGTLSDRLDLKRLMIACELAQGALVAAIALLLPSLPLLLALVALRAIAAQIFQPASRAAVPALVRDRDLEAANAALGAGTNGLELLGPLLAVALLPVLDIRGVLAIDAASFALSALLLARLPALPPRRIDGDERLSFLADARAGLGYIWSVPLVRTVGLGFFAIVAINGVDDVALVFLAKDELGGGDGAASLLYAGVGIGLVVGYALLGVFGARVGMAGLLVLGFAVNSAGNLLTGVAWAIAAALAVQTVRGLGISAMDVATNTLLQRRVPPAMLGRTFGNLYGAIGVAAGLSYALGGLLLALTSPRTTFVAVGAAGLVATLATALALARALRAPGSAIWNDAALMARPPASSIVRMWAYQVLTRLPGPSRALTRPLLATGPLCVGGADPAKGMLLRALPPGHVQAWGLVHGVLEAPVQEALRRHVARDSVVWDVGANVGFFALLAARLGARRVECFEPVAANVAAIEANVAANALAERVGIHPVAVGASAGRGALCVVDEASWSHLADRGHHPRTVSEEQVDVVALDGLELPPPQVVKIDVEGSEVAVLEGASELLRRERPLLIVELHATNAEVCDLLEDAGYAIENLDGPEPVREAGPVHVLARPA